MIRFSEFGFLSVAYLIRGVTKCILFWNPRIKAVLHWWSRDVHIFHTEPSLVLTEILCYVKFNVPRHELNVSVFLAGPFKTTPRNKSLKCH